MRSSDVVAAIAASYRQPEWATFFEVSDGTGARKTRSADAVAVNMYPSRGLSINGFEVKVDRNDWRRELADPRKAEAIAQYCDFWWVAAPKDLIDPKELPTTWGLTEVDEKGALRIKVQAKALKPKAVTRDFFASLCRSKAKVDEKAVDALVARKLAVLRDQDAANNAREVERRSARATELAKQHAAFEAAVARHGRLSHLREDDIVRGLEMLDALGILSGWGQLRSLLTTAKNFAKTVEGIEANYLTKKEET